MDQAGDLVTGKILPAYNATGRTDTMPDTAKNRFSALLFYVLVRLLSAQGVFVREALVCCSFPMATIVVLFATKYKSLEGETASILLLSTLSLIVTVPLTIALGREDSSPGGEAKRKNGCDISTG